MSLTITLELPPDVEEKIRAGTSHLDADVLEAYALELYRQEKLNKYELSKVLGIDRHETSALLQRHKIYVGSLTMNDLEADGQTLEKLFKKDG